MGPGYTSIGNGRMRNYNLITFMPTDAIGYASALNADFDLLPLSSSPRCLFLLQGSDQDAWKQTYPTGIDISLLQTASAFAPALVLFLLVFLSLPQLAIGEVKGDWA